MQLAFILLGYFMGSLLFGYRITWLIKGVDIRELADDENPGTYNAFVFGGFWCGILTLLADMGKGYLPVMLYRQRYGMENLIFAFVMAAPVLGHAFSVFHGSFTDILLYIVFDSIQDWFTSQTFDRDFWLFFYRMSGVGDDTGNYSGMCHDFLYCDL